MALSELDAEFVWIWPSLEDAHRLGPYRPAPLREVEIPKPDGSKRLLRIPTATDNVVYFRQSPGHLGEELGEL